MAHLVLILCHSAFFDERLGILLHNWSMLLDCLVHHGLGEKTEVCTVGREGGRRAGGEDRGVYSIGRKGGRRAEGGDRGVYSIGGGLGERTEACTVGRKEG